MKTNRWIAMVTVVGLGCLAAGYWVARRPMSTPNAEGTDRSVLYWYDPMVPNQHFDKPGKSPYMDMQLVPKYAEEVTSSDAAGGVRIDPNVLQNLGIRFATVQRAVLAQPVTAVGSLGFNQRDIAVVQARTGGFVSRVHPHAPGDVITKNTPLVEVLVPEWTAAQTEFIALLGITDAALIEAARQRLLLLGMSKDLVERVERSRQPQSTLTIAAPIGGMLESLEVRNGMTLSAGMTLAKINGLATVWLEAAIPEVHSGLVSQGTRATAQLTAYPGKTYEGRVIVVLPEANAESRTIRARIELPNTDGRLRPGMVAQVQLDTGNAEPVLWVPTEAVVRSGTRNVVIVADEAGRFEPVEVQIGNDAGGKTSILSGLQEGQKIVASGQFLIDSEASLQGVIARLNPQAAATPAATAFHAAAGKIEALTDIEVLISHGPVPALEWPAMTMPFKVENSELTKSLKVGDAVQFEFEQHDDLYVLKQIRKQGSTP